MNVGELIEKLQQVDPATLVILQKDSEGNGFSPLADVDPGFYEAATTWMGEVYEYKQGESVPCLVLSPIN